MNANVVISPVNPFVPLSQDDIEDIRSLFRHTPRSYGADQRDLRQAAQRINRSESILTFSLRTVFPSNTK